MEKARAVAMRLMVVAMAMVNMVAAASTTSSGALINAATADVSCIQVVQEDLRFSHPVSLASVRINCGECSVSEVRLACPGPEWIQELVDASFLSVQGNGQCLLAPGQILAPSSNTEFIYLHSPPLPLSPISATFQC